MRYYIHIGVYDPETKRYFPSYTTQSYTKKNECIRQADLLATILDPIECKPFSCVFVTTVKGYSHYNDPTYLNEFGF